MAKLVNCKVCNAEISSGAKACPSCGHKNKKPIFKQWWFYVVFVVVIIVIAIGSSDDSDAPVSNTLPDESQNAATGNQVLQEQPTSDNDNSEITPVDIYRTIGENPDMPYTLSSKAEDFLKEHPELFSHTGSVDELQEYTDFGLETKHINKNPNNYGDKLIYLGNVLVNQIFEEEITPSIFLTELNLVDEYGDQFYTLYIGQLDDIFENDELQIYGLPLNTSSFENTGGGTTLVVVLAGSHIEKLY